MHVFDINFEVLFKVVVPCVHNKCRKYLNLIVESFFSEIQWMKTCEPLINAMTH